MRPASSRRRLALRASPPSIIRARRAISLRPAAPSTSREHRNRHAGSHSQARRIAGRQDPVPVPGAELRHLGHRRRLPAGRRPDWAAEVGGVEDLHRGIPGGVSRRRCGGSARRSAGPVEAEQARALGLPRSVLDRMIEGALFDRAAADLGVTLTDAVVREQIKSNPQFRNQAGAFDPEVFRAAAAPQPDSAKTATSVCSAASCNASSSSAASRRHRAAAKPGRERPTATGASGASPSTR